MAESAQGWCLPIVQPNVQPALVLRRASGTASISARARCRPAPKGISVVLGSLGSGGEASWGSPGGALRSFELMKQRDVAESLDAWSKACRRDIEVFGKDDTSLDKKVRVERVFRLVLSEERLEVHDQMQKWLSFMGQDRNNMVLGSMAKDSKELTAMAALEATRMQGKEGQADVDTLRVLSIAVCPDGNPGTTSGGWTGMEDYSALQMVEGITAMAKNRQMIADFSPLQEVHEGRLYLKSDPFSSKGLSRGIM